MLYCLAFVTTDRSVLTQATQANSRCLKFSQSWVTRTSIIISIKQRQPIPLITSFAEESEESEDKVGFVEENEVTDIENKVDVTMADTSQQQGQQMPDIQQMLARLLVNQQALQNEFPGLADAQRETDRRLNDVIAGGTGGGIPPAPFAPAVVLPVPPVATVNVQPQLHKLLQF